MNYYFVNYKTGKISKGIPKGMGFSSGLTTCGYRNAQTVARLVKKGDDKGVLYAANNGIECEMNKF